MLLSTNCTHWGSLQDQSFSKCFLSLKQCCWSLWDQSVSNCTKLYKLYNLWVPLGPISFRMSKLYKTVHTVQTWGSLQRPIIFKMFTKSEKMLLVPLLPIRFKLYTLYNLYNLWVPLGPISFKMYTLYTLYNLWLVCAVVENNGLNWCHKILLTDRRTDSVTNCMKC